MKYIATPALALAAFALAVPAFAGGYTEPAPEPIIAPAPVVPVAATGNDWTGGYGGLSLGYGWGADAADEADDMVYGLFGGYNYDFGNFVLGGELEHALTEMENDDVSIDSMTRLKLRAGYDLGKTLVYGVVGANHAKADIGGKGLADTGYSYGLGLDYAMTDNIALGAEVLRNEFSDFDNNGTDLSATTLGARVSFRF